MSSSGKSLLARTAAVSGLASVVLCVGVVVGVRIAKADPGGPTRPSLSFAGVLRNADGTAITTARPASLTFAFTNARRARLHDPRHHRDHRSGRRLQRVGAHRRLRLDLLRRQQHHLHRQR